MNDLGRRLTEYLAAKVAAEHRYADIEDQLDEADICALDAVATDTFAAFVAQMRSHLDAEMSVHPLAAQILHNTAAAREQRGNGQRVRQMAARLFDNDQVRIDRVMLVSEALHLAMVFEDFLPAQHFTELAVPWRAALGTKYDIGRLGIVVDMTGIAVWRETGSACPSNAARIDLHVCADCEFFRGASSGAGVRQPDHQGPKMLCNWPRLGNTVAVPVPSIRSREDRLPLPSWFREAFSGKDDAAV